LALVGWLALLVVGAAAPSRVEGSAVGVIPGQYIVVLTPGADQAADVAAARNLGGEVFLQYHYALNGFAARLPTAALTRLQHAPGVLFIAADEAGWQARVELRSNGRAVPADGGRADRRRQEQHALR
jgi:hypothetical protein